MQADFNISFVIPLLNAIINDPSAPNDADSVGVAIPKELNQVLKLLKELGGKIVKNKLPKLFFHLNSLLLERFLGLKIEQINIQNVYIITSNIPGKIAPANKSTLLTGVGARSPVICDACSFAPWKISASKTNTIEGGIICPKVPLAQIIPAEIFIIIPFKHNW